MLPRYFKFGPELVCFIILVTFCIFFLISDLRIKQQRRYYILKYVNHSLIYTVVVIYGIRCTTFVSAFALILASRLVVCSSC